MVASTALDGTDAASVVTPDSANRDAAATNGVLSQGPDGTTQVQWATILAPPQIGPSATLKLVLDAKDFKAPAFDLSVQPGLVTDPSVGALVDAAFQPGSSSELKLQARTIGLVGEVNTVLARAGETISTVRSTLDTSADTLGTKTAGDLQASATGVAASMKGLDGSVKSLGQDLSSSLESTRSSAVQQLLQTVDVLDQMLGDTSVKPQPATVRGTGCDTTVAPPQSSSSVYGNLVQVASQLGGYAKATGSCKVSLQQDILDSVGPAEPSADTCTTPSVTCALYGARTSFGEIADKLVTDGDTALSGLEPMKIQDAVKASEQLSADVDAVSTATAGLMNATPFGRTHVKLKDVNNALSGVRESTQGLRGVVDGIHTNAVNAQGDIDAMANQNAALAAKLCDMVGDGSQPDTLSTEKVEELRSYLVTTSCDGSRTLPAPGGFAAPMATRIEAQKQAWAAVAAATATSDTSQGTGQALATLASSIENVQQQIDALGGNVDDDSRSVRTQITTLDSGVRDLLKARTDVAERIATVRDQQASAIAGVKEALKAAADDASTQVPSTRSTRRSAACRTARRRAVRTSAGCSTSRPPACPRPPRRSPRTARRPWSSRRRPSPGASRRPAPRSPRRSRTACR